MPALKLPRCFDGIRNGSRVAAGEVSDDHHVLYIEGRDGERSRELRHNGIAVIEVGANHQVHIVKLAGDQPAAIPPLGQPLPLGAAHPRQGLGQVAYFVDLHRHGLMIP